MVTMMNSVVSLLRNNLRTSLTCAFNCSSFSTASSCLSSPTPKMPLTASVALVSFCRKRTILPIDASKKSGSDSRRSVCPVGAVSKTMRVNLLNFSSFVNCSTFAMAIASSNPGGGVSKSSPSFKSAMDSANPPKPTELINCFAPAPMSFSLANAVNSALALSGSISSANNIPSVSDTSTGIPPRTSCAKESDNECAGSVLTTSVLCPLAANLTANDDDNDVFPTPPLPPTM